MGKVRDREYGEMYAAYLKVEDKYWEWAALYREFQRKKAAGYYYTFPKKSKKFDRIDAVLRDYPIASSRDISGATRLSLYMVQKAAKGKYDDDIFYHDEYPMWEIFDRLQRNPDDLYDAIEDTYEWSKKVHIRTGLIAKYLPKVLIKIGELELC